MECIRIGDGRTKHDWDNIMVFDNGWKIISYHRQSCCENVWADFEALFDTSFMSSDFDSLEITSCDYGFSINGYFVPCYDIQNGYYSNNLTISIIDDKDNIVKTFNEVDFKYEKY